MLAGEVFVWLDVYLRKDNNAYKSKGLTGVNAIKRVLTSLRAFPEKRFSSLFSECRSECQL